MIYVAVYGAGRYPLVVNHLTQNGVNPLPQPISELEQSWPIDYGDDPSFLASALLRDEGGCLSWGICRPSLRKSFTREGTHIVAFMAYEGDNKNGTYKLAAVATVRECLSQLEIVQGPHTPYDKYANLLIGMGNSIEAILHRELDNRNHPNWLWRIAEAYSPYKEKDLEEVSKRESIQFGEKIGVYSFGVGKNYVIFANDTTYIFENPPIVAEFHESGHESWRQDDVSTILKRYTVDHDDSSRKYIRVNRKRNPHPQLVIRHTNPEEWRDSLVNELRAYGVIKANWC
jgi:hypothetical protein